MMELVQTLQSLAQTGLAYTKDPFDRQRFDAILGLAVKLLQQKTGLAQDQAEALILEDRGYRTPKVDVRGGIFHKDRILLVRERSDGLWCLPGGWADINETPRQAVERELFEETGLKTQALKLAAVHDTNCRGPKQFYHSYKLLFVCHAQEGQPHPTAETSAADFFPRDALPPLSAKRTTIEQIDLLFHHWLNPERPTDFD
ncbi:MAG TPA: NUDIX hydrolase [Oligoflexus sp.]|uniref:NUDIX hydrolase n=1 Tax=Oligoflexus sp. TaxID=1971216 RepID=UPI002D29A426|nr:NUDIX hydrolase [Oligoflexus sp.]HYX33545.1 NUDIX hydrolase [Oligoflexus sp.]